ncbi:DedA family protein [Heyndrickxia sporothermodurans]
MNIEVLFEQYGYFVLFIGLLLEFIALPFPGEIAMLYIGYLSYQGDLNGVFMIFIAFFGTIIGMTITYFIGLKAGMPFVNRFGKWFFLSPNKLDKTKKWFNKHGNFLVFIAYFIPGVRHVTGYFSGIIGSPFKTFAIFAYTGALFWCICFIGLGYIFGPQWGKVLQYIERYSWNIAIIAALLIFLSWFVKKIVRSLRYKKAK